MIEKRNCDMLKPSPSMSEERSYDMSETWRNGKLARLGFGCMRLPTIEADEERSIDHDLLCEMVDHYMQSGFSYFDVARGYHQGSAEGALKRALVDRYPRDKYQIASKLTAYLTPSQEEAERMFYISLEDTQAQYFDYYMLHNLGGQRTEKYREYKSWAFVAEQKRAGSIDNLGFSFHGSPDELEQLLNEFGEADFVQLQINFADWEDEQIQSRRCYEIARSHDMEIIVMEPVKGGLLANLPQEARSYFDRNLFSESDASIALRFSGSLEGVTTVLSGMSSLEQVEENCTVFNNGKPLSVFEKSVVARSGQIIRDLERIPCTNCNYCVDVCPQGVRIPQALSSLNILTVYNDFVRAQQSYLWAIPQGASCCIKCASCEKVCPQGIPIVDCLEYISQVIEFEDVESVEFF